MRLTKHAARGLALVAALALTATACGGEPTANRGGGGGGGATAVGQGTRGGTLKLLNIADFEHIDPQRVYVSNALNFTERLLTRMLTTYKSEPGPGGSEIVPDLATDLGRSSNGAKTWEFTLKDGVKWEDGSPITCEDIKYGISRTFSDQITEGPQYARNYLAVDRNAQGDVVYKGPYVAGPNGGFDRAVVCKDQKTIQFNLAIPVGDFNYTVTLPAFSGVPKAKDKGPQYDRSVVASGPYKIESYTPKRSLVLTRNDQWDQATDPVRKAYPDRIEVTMGLDPAVIDQRLVADAPADQTAIQNDSEIQPENLARVLNDPNLKRRTVSGFDGSDWYMSINTKKVTNIKVRQAIQAAVNRRPYLTALGGPNEGEYAYSHITPVLKSHKKFPFPPPPGVPPEGDQNRARQLMQESGAPTPYALRLDVANRPARTKAAAAIKEALDAVGFRVTINPLGPDGYYTLIGKAAASGELIYAGWGPDWPNGSSVIPPLYEEVLPEGNQNFAQLEDPEIDRLIKQAANTTDLNKQAQLWGDLDQKIILDKAAVVPLHYGRTNQLFGSKVKGAYLHAFFGEIDLATLSVA